MFLYPPGLTILFHLEAEQLHTAHMTSGLLKLTNGGKEAVHQDHEALTSLSLLFPPKGTDKLIRVTGLPAPSWEPHQDPVLHEAIEGVNNWMGQILLWKCTGCKVSRELSDLCVPEASISHLNQCIEFTNLDLDILLVPFFLGWIDIS